MSEERVSVVIPAYNHERFVGAAIESVLNQTYPHLELIIVDDGSKDHTWEVIQRYTDPRIRAVTQENQDAFNTINRGLKMAQGRFVAILNSDDVYAPNRLERLIAEQADTGAEFIFTEVQPVDVSGHPVTDPAHPWNVWHQRNRQFYIQSGRDLYVGFLHGNFMVTTSNVFMTRSARETVGDFCALRYLHDYDFIFRVLNAFPGQVRYLEQEPLVQYRLHGSNTLSEGAILARQQDQHVIRTYLLAGVPESIRPRVTAGADRLLELERELVVERDRLSAMKSKVLRVQATELVKNLRTELSRRLHR